MTTSADTEAELAISAAWILALLDAFRQLGLDTEALLRRALIDGTLLQDPDSRISRDAAGRLWREALLESGDPQLGLHAGERVRLRMNHLVPLLLMSAESFGEGARVAIRYQELLSHARVISLEESDGQKGLRLHKVESTLPVTEQEVEFMAATLLELFRLATSQEFSLAEVHFAHARRGRIEEYQRVFGCAVLFEQEHTELIVGEEAWNMPLPHHSTSLQAQFELMAASLYDKVRTAKAATDVSQKIRALLPTGQFDIEQVASAMHTTARTLQRRLRAENTSFRDVLDATRRRVVIDCVEHDCSMEDLMRLAGFSDVRSVRRALRKWELQLERN